MNSIPSAPARKRSKKVILLVLAILLAVAAIVGYNVWQHVRPYSPYKFRPNKWEEPYSKIIPLDEMNFGEYGYSFRPYASGAYPDMVNTVQLPCGGRGCWLTLLAGLSEGLAVWRPVPP